MAGDIIKGSDHFFTTTYEGNGAGQKAGRFVPFTAQATLANSLKFDVGSAPKLSRVPTTTGNRRTFTVSAWVRFSSETQNSYIVMWSESGNNNGMTRLWRDSNDKNLNFHSTNDAGANKMSISTNRTLEDFSKWYHIVVAVDTTQGTDANKIKLYIDGEQETSFSYSNYSGGTNYDTQANLDDWTHTWGQAGFVYTQYMEGYLAQCILVDGTAYGPDTFGVTDTSSGLWIPKTLGSITYGTNGNRLDFANTAGQTFGDDTSGQGNDYTVTNLTADDLTTETPTSSWSIMGANYHSGATNTITEGGRRMQPATGSDDGTFFDMKFKTGKWYAECYAHSADAVAQYIYNGIADFEAYVTAGVQEIGKRAHTYAWDPANERYYAEGSAIGSSSGKMTQGDIMGIAMDFDNNKIYFAKNNTYILSSNPTTGAGGMSFDPAENTPSGYYRLGQSNGTGSSGYNNDVSWNVGDNPTFNGTLAVGAAANTDGFGSTFKFAPPTGFKGLKFSNQPDEGAKPDFVWIKNRDATDAHAFYDSSRGPQKEWENSESNEATVTDGLQKFIKGGFEVEDNDALNTDSESYVAWNWVANGGTEVANTAGSGATVATTVQANDTAGFSICRFQGTGSTLRFAHGLSATPEWFITKRLDAGAGAATSVYHVSNGINEYLHLNESDAVVDSGAATSQFTGVSSSYIELGSNSNSNNNGSDVIAYVWRSVPGFSKFGSYKGNGNADGTFVFTGFKPSWLMVKRTDSGGNDWQIWDTKRSTINPITNQALFPNGTTVEGGTNVLDFLSNGFKWRSTGDWLNASGGTYVYMAFAEHPFNGDGENAFATAR